MLRRNVEVINPTNLIIGCGRKTFLPLTTTKLVLDETALAEIKAHTGLKITILSVICPYCGKAVSAASRKGLAAHMKHFHKEIDYDGNPVLQQRT